MIDAVNETSYIEADRLIAEAAASGATELSLDCLRIEELPPALGELTRLESLNLSNCYWLEDVSVLSKLVALGKLDMHGCGRVSDLSVFASFPGLKWLSLIGCHRVVELSALAKLPHLQWLNLSGSQVTDLSVLANLPVLQSLDLGWCGVSDLSVLANHRALQSLSIHGCRQITDLSVLAGLSALQSLNISWCQQVDDLSVLANLADLRSLDLGWCEEVSDLLALKNLSLLESLDLSGCKQVTDLSALKNFPNLRSLNLSGCKQVTDLSVLTSLSALTSLDISGCKQVTDLTVLTGLSALTSLDISGCKEVTDLSVLENLPALQSLELRVCEKVEDLSVLASLPALQSLDLGGVEQVADLSVLAKLSTLQSLTVRRCKQVTDLSVLKNLSALRFLDLSECDQVTDLSELKNFPYLQSLSLSGCKQVTDLSVLADLPTLQSLTLSGCKHVTDISALKNLSALQSLDLGECDQVTDLSVLANLSALRYLNLQYLPSQTPLTNLRQLRWLWGGRIEDSSLTYVPPRLTDLLVGEDFCVDNAPPELFHDREYDNSLTELIPWQRDIYASGAVPNTELKIFVLGNGRVGKTQIARRLQGRDYDPSIASTHGIVLGRFELLAPEDSNPAINANLWDFGGQDVYLGTHGLFLDARAVYVVVWNPGHENDIEYFENGVPMHNRPLGYWLAYIRSLAGADAPIIVVQSQCDRESDVKMPPLPDAHGFKRLRFTSCSAKSSHGMELLEPEIRAAARLLRDRYAAVQIPQSWVAVSEKLRGLHSQGHKALSYEEFEKLCHDYNGLNYPSVAAGYLHRTGQVFWREGAFGNDLLLDQEWALEGIYALLERNAILPMIRDSHGRFNLRQLQLTVWQKYNDKEQRLFLDMMKQCGTCFPLGNDQYIAAELLPSERARRTDIDAVWRDAEVAAKVELHYDFLHDGIIKAILCKIGEKAGNAGVYWRHGVCYFDPYCCLSRGASRGKTRRTLSAVHPIHPYRCFTTDRMEYRAAYS